MLSEVSIRNIEDVAKGLALVTLFVLPNFQNKGIGSSLLTELENRAKDKNIKYISILGNPAYYSKLGYVPTSRYKITAAFEVPDEFFLIK